MGITDDMVEFANGTAQRTLQRLDGLSDDEFRWQPVPGAWTVRRLAGGRVIVDNNVYQPAPAPMTSVAWRVAHLIDVYASPRNSRWLRIPEPAIPPIQNTPWTIAWTADESIAILRTAIDHFVGLLKAMDEAVWFEELGPGAEPYEKASLFGFALHQIDEAIHHGAEIGVVRDLYHWRNADDTEPATVGAAALAGRWDLVERLVAAGADVGGSSPTALHLAAALGDLELVRLLVDHGADVTQKDEVFNGTPSFWARYFGRDEVVEFLRGRGGQTETTS